MTLTPEMEALVEAGAMLLSGDHPTSWERRPDNKKQLRELARAGIVAPDTITRDDYRDDARAIIPLIYTAGRRAGREEIAAWIEPQRQDTPAHGWEFAAAIRNLSEQESGR